MEIEEIIKQLSFSNIAWQVTTPIIFMIADIFTGFVQAVINHSIKSQVMREGLLHKVLILIILILSFISSITFNLPIISKFVCAYIIIMEFTSILENLKKANIDLGILKKIFIGDFKNGKKETDKNKENNSN